MGVSEIVPGPHSDLAAVHESRIRQVPRAEDVGGHAGGLEGVDHDSGSGLPLVEADGVEAGPRLREELPEERPQFGVPTAPVGVVRTAVPSESSIGRRDDSDAVPPRSSFPTTPTETPAASASYSCVIPPRSAFKRSEVVYSDHSMVQNLRVVSPTRTVLAEEGARMPLPHKEVALR
ncbi:hypothetical protein ACFTWD_02720 [Streptomyces sp. NPDC056943]|uniref:hypothetical protein n=1 Tax=Streptomyces sp. NPDC056943 TaxID=3345971 RepID=UPI0036258973